MKINNFYDLTTWKKSHELVIDIYRITKDYPRDELYGVVSQLRRASSSITANIAEGFSRYHFKDKIRFYYHSRGSLAEVQNFLLLSKDLSYIDNKLSEELFRKTIDVAKLVNGLIRSTESQIN
ncbi:four helix bundle protein [Candidatus Parcubacteria bacterium]|jgi:four helix bundle protein|nr:four helix bundle protein [Candidatus Parcubacteria bacterium]